MPQKLTYTEGIYKYFRTLAEKSPRVKVFSAGKTDEGRDILVVAIANEATIGNLEQYRGYLAQLADPRRLTEEQHRCDTAFHESTSDRAEKKSPEALTVNALQQVDLVEFAGVSRHAAIV